MSDYRAYKVEAITGSITLGPNTKYSRAWGVMKGEFPCSGSITLEGGGSINLGSLDQHQIFPCYPSAISCSAGTIMILS